ncbi:hypothetical protein ACXMRQ_004808 [Shigella boydii]
MAETIAHHQVDIDLED